MTAKEYLSEIHKQRRLLRTLELRAEELRTQAEGVKAIKYDRDKVQVSPTNMMEEIVPKLVEVEEQIGRQIIRVQLEIDKRIEQIAQMRPDHAEVLLQRYVDTDHGKPLTWEQIAVNIHRSFVRVTHLHGEALAEFTRRFLKVDKL